MKITLFIISFFFVSAMFSQNAFGLKMGVFNSKQTYEHPYGSGAKSISGIEAGVLLRKSIIKNFYVQPEILFVQKGGEGFFDNRSLVVRSKNIELDILLGYKLNVKKILIYVNAGGFYGNVFDTNLIEDPFLGNHKFIFYKKDYGITYGGEIAYQFNKFIFSIDVRGRQSLHGVGKAIFYGSFNDPLFDIKIQKHQGIGVALKGTIIFSK